MEEACPQLSPTVDIYLYQEYMPCLPGLQPQDLLRAHYILPSSGHSSQFFPTSVLRMEPRGLCRLGMHSSIELYPQPFLSHFLSQGIKLLILHLQLHHTCIKSLPILFPSFHSNHPCQAGQLPLQTPLPTGTQHPLKDVAAAPVTSPSGGPLSTLPSDRHPTRPARTRGQSPPAQLVLSGERHSELHSRATGCPATRRRRAHS